MLAEAEPQNPNWQMLLGLVAAHRGDRAAASAISARIANLSVENLRVYGVQAPGRSVWQAELHAMLGQPDSALIFLRRAAAAGEVYNFNTHSDPALRSLRALPEFRAMLMPKD
jgi:hypothetical protein